MTTKGACLPRLRAGLCFGAFGRKDELVDNLSSPKTSCQDPALLRARSPLHGSFTDLVTPALQLAEVEVQPGALPSTPARTIQLGSARCTLSCASGEPLRQQVDDEALHETDLFLESMLSDVKARARIIFTLDTNTSELALLETNQSEITATQPAAKYVDRVGTSFDPDEQLRNRKGGRPGEVLNPKSGDACQRRHPDRPSASLAQRDEYEAITPRLAADSEPCRTRFVDAAPANGTHSVRGFCGAAALSAEARLSTLPKVPPSPASNRDVSSACGASISGRVRLIPAELHVNNPAALISDYNGCRALQPAAAARLAEKYGVPLKDNPVHIMAAYTSNSGGIETRAGQGSKEGTTSGLVTEQAIIRESDDGVVIGGGDGCGDAIGGLVDDREPSHLAAKSNSEAQQELPSVIPSLLGLLSDIEELTCLAPPGTLGGVWIGDWRGNRIAVKLTACGGVWSLHGPALNNIARVSRLRHPNLLHVYALRVAVADEAALSELDPPPTLRPSWAAGRRPAARLHRFLAAHPEIGVRDMGCRVDASLTLYPGDLVTSSVVQTPAHQALMAIRPKLGGGVVATLMEYCEMGNLLSLACGDRSPFCASRFWTARVAQRALLRTAREIASAMCALHGAGLTHGALRPTNVLLSRSDADRRGFVARVADVGSVSLSYAASNPIASGPCMLFLAPEALQDEAAECTRAADVYSFGMLLYVMAAGKLPFQGQHLVPILLAVASDSVRPEWPSHEHPHLESLFRRCVAQSPDERSSFKQILLDICSLETQIKAQAQAGVAPSAPSRLVRGYGAI